MDHMIMIEVEHLSKVYGNTPAVNDVSFSVAQGEILGLLGTNGAGKTTIMRILTGYFTPTSGRAVVAGVDVTTQTVEARRQIGYLPENVPLYPEMRVRDFLHFVASINGVTGKDATKAVDKTLEEINLTSVARRLIGNLSKGYRQRVGIAQAVVSDPPVLILDEPTVGLDPAQVVEIRHYIKSLAGRKTVILSTHILPEVAATCQKVVIIHRGKMMAWGELNHLHSRAQTESTTEFTIKGAFDNRLRKGILETRGVRAIGETQSLADGRTRVTIKVDPGTTPSLARTVINCGGQLLDLKESGGALEDMFMQAISGRLGE